MIAAGLLATAMVTTTAGNAVERISLSDAVARALAKNPTITTAAEELTRTYALLEEARASALPTITGNATYTRLDSDRTFPSGPPAPGMTPSPPRVIIFADSRNANALLSVPLFVPGKWREWKYAADAVQVASASEKDARRQIALAVGRAWLTVLAAERIVSVDQQAIKDDSAHQDYSATRLKGGVGNRVDLVRAQQQLAADRASLEGATAAVLSAEEALGVAMGEDHRFDASPSTLPPAPALEDAIGDTKKRPDIVAASERAKIAHAVDEGAWTDYVPTVTGTFEPFYQSPASLTQPETGWQAQVLLTWNLYDGGFRYGQEKSNRSLAIEADLALSGALRQALSDVRSAADAVTHADAALSAARDSANLARQALELANIAYRAGATTNIEVIDAEKTAVDAETQAAIAEDNANQARLSLLSSSGRFP